jgi:hypothetical protein
MNNASHTASNKDCTEGGILRAAFKARAGQSLAQVISNDYNRTLGEALKHWCGGRPILALSSFLPQSISMFPTSSRVPSCCFFFFFVPAAAGATPAGPGTQAAGAPLPGSAIYMPGSACEMSLSNDAFTPLSLLLLSNADYICPDSRQQRANYPDR